MITSSIYCLPCSKTRDFEGGSFAPKHALKKKFWTISSFAHDPPTADGGQTQIFLKISIFKSMSPKTIVYWSPRRTTINENGGGAVRPDSDQIFHVRSTSLDPPSLEHKLLNK